MCVRDIEKENNRRERERERERERGHINRRDFDLSLHEGQLFSRTPLWPLFRHYYSTYVY